MQLDRKHFEEIYSRFLECGLTVKDFSTNEGFALSKFCYCTGMKILHMEYGQLVIYQIILPEGSFRLPDIEANTGALHSSWQNLIGICG